MLPLRAALLLGTLVLAVGVLAPSAGAREPVVKEVYKRKMACRYVAPCHNFPSEVWLISARCYCCEKHPRLQYWRLRDCCWVRSSLEEFLASSTPGVPSCFWIHGWRISHEDATAAGLYVYHRLRRWAPCPFRLVIWSWPAQQTKPLLQDAREKAYLSEVGGYPLAWVIDQIDPGVPVSLVGFSLGARLSTSALHMLSGGQLWGMKLIHRVHPVREPMRAVLLAGALDNFSLVVGGRNGLALDSVDRLLNMVNPADNVLKWYPLLAPDWNGPQAIGYTGAVGDLGANYPKLREMCVSHIVGPQHQWDPYIDSPYILSAISDTALFADRLEQAEPPVEPVARKKRRGGKRAAR